VHSSLLLLVSKILIPTKKFVHIPHHDQDSLPDPKTWIPESALFIAAHPDDIETAAGGTIAKWVAQGTNVSYLLLTNGDKGTQNRSIDPQQFAKLRQQEQIDAAALLNVSNVWFLNILDGEVENNNDTRSEVTYYIRKTQPEVVVTWNPDNRFQLFKLGIQHHDHQKTGEIVLQCVYPTARDYWYFPNQIDFDGLQTAKVKYVLLFSWIWEQNTEQNIVIPLSDDDLQMKINARLAHKSQVENPSTTVSYLTNIARTLGTASNYQYAEWFLRIPTMS